MRRLLTLATVFVAGAALAPLSAADEAAPPPLPREFRAAWIATVANIDWPSRRGLPAERQQEEMVAMLDMAAALKLNAVVLQIRTMCDSLYKSDLEPWSEFLSGACGQPPEPPYDPLEFAVREAHARGLELHAWLNPYRAWVPSARSPVPDTHLVKRRPDLAKRYGKHHWLNPTHPEVQEHSLKVFLDVVKRYDLDGIHMDDYFYPYPEAGEDKKEIPFPDDDTWEAYQKSGGTLARDDWRRDAVNRFVERLYAGTKSAKPWVKVGISPFGIWRPGHPQGIQGFDQYAKLYADARLWLHKGWVDYFTPQLYWQIDRPAQSYPKLLAWWAAENPQGRHLWPGNFTSRVLDRTPERHWEPTEIVNQIKVTRDQKGAGGNVHFSMKALMGQSPMVEPLRAVYAEPALVPATPWLGPKAQVKLGVEWQNRDGRRELVVRPAGEPVRQVVVRSLTGGKWTTNVRGADGPTVVPFPAAPEKVFVSAFDRLGHEIGPVAVGR